MPRARRKPTTPSPRPSTTLPTLLSTRLSGNVARWIGPLGSLLSAASWRRGSSPIGMQDRSLYVADMP
jgi:hypothetical protein